MITSNQPLLNGKASIPWKNKNGEYKDNSNSTTVAPRVHVSTEIQEWNVLNQIIDNQDLPAGKQ